MSANEVARRWGLPVSSVSYAARTGALPAKKMNGLRGTYVIDPDAAERWVITYLSRRDRRDQRRAQNA